jgi:hypothetical protein
MKNEIPNTTVTTNDLKNRFTHIPNAILSINRHINVATVIAIKTNKCDFVNG